MGEEALIHVHASPTLSIRSRLHSDHRDLAYSFSKYRNPVHPGALRDFAEHWLQGPEASGLLFAQNLSLVRWKSQSELP